MDHDLTPSVHNFLNVPYDDDLFKTFTVQYADGTDVEWRGVTNVVGHVRVLETLDSAKLFDLSLETPVDGRIKMTATDAELKLIHDAGGKAFYSIRGEFNGGERTFISGFIKTKVYATFVP